MKEIFQNINKKEWLFVLAAAFVLIVITTAPLIYGYMVKPENKFFPAIHSAGAGDFAVYYSYINQTKEGELIFKDLFTSEWHSPFIFNPFWLLVGLGARFFNLSSIAAYQIARILLIIIFSFVLYAFIGYFFEKIKERKICFFFMVIASGLGGYFMPVISNIYNGQITLKNNPMDLWVSEGFTFFTLYHSPHFIMATILIICSLFLMYYSFLKKKWLYTLEAGLIANFLIFFHPFHLPTLLAVILVYIFVKSFRDWHFHGDYLKKYLVFVFLIFPAALYHFLIIMYNPIAAGRAEGNLCLTPYWWTVIISYGLILPFALWGLLKKIKSERFVFIITWAIVQFILIFSPLSFQRRLTQGLQIPLTLLAFAGLCLFYNLLSKKIKTQKWLYGQNIILLIMLIIFFSGSYFYVIAQDIDFLHNPKFREPPEYIYLDLDFKKAFDWLAEETNDEAVVLGDYVSSQFASGFALKRTYFSHWAETLNFFDKGDNVKKFYQVETEEQWRRDFLEREKIDYVFYTPFEKRRGEYNPASSDYLSLVFKRGNVAIYRFLSP